jgi:protein TonB
MSLLSVAAFLGGCAARQDTTRHQAPAAIPDQAAGDAATVPQEFVGPQAGAPMTPPAEAILSTLEDYKREVARSIVRGSLAHLYEGAPPPLLKSVIVLSIAVDADGQLRRVAVLRSNGIRALEQIALQSVKSAAPLPRPGIFAARRGLAEFTETWLFRDDNRFQIRSLADAQAES